MKQGNKNRKGAPPRRGAPAHVRAGRLIRQKRAEQRKKQAKEEAKLCRGVFCGNRRGFGFVETEDGISVFIPPSQTLGALDGEAVECMVFPSSREKGKWEGAVKRLREPRDYYLNGILLKERLRGKRDGAKYYVAPISQKLPERFAIEDSGGARHMDRVLLCVPADREKTPYIAKVYGPADSIGASYRAILEEAGIREEFDPSVLRYCEKVAQDPLATQNRPRVKGPAFTVDGAGAKDLDDAVSLSPTEKGWLLGVHIADVSEYVRPHTPADTAAMERGTSVYFADRVVPMLPPSLSNGACSLNAGEDKAVLSAYVTVSPSGELLSCEVREEILSSAVRGVYSEVNEVLKTGEDSCFFQKYKEVYPTLLQMRELAGVLEQAGRAGGAMEFEAPGAAILLDEEGFPEAILPVIRGISERMVEQFMLAANRAVATLLTQKGIPLVYRIHETPPKERLEDFLVYAHNLGLSVGHIKAATVTAGELSALLREAEERGLGKAISYPMLRAMAKARYSPEAQGHFGLAFPLYCHFTSPIRRLADLATHRILKGVLLRKEAPEGYLSYAKRAAEAATEGELRALSAEREIEAMYKALYLSRHIGEEFQATVTSVASFGAFAELENTAEGLLPIEELPGYFTFDEERLALRSSRFAIRIADTLRVRVEGVDTVRHRAIFSLVL